MNTSSRHGRLEELLRSDAADFRSQAPEGLGARAATRVRPREAAGRRVRALGPVLAAAAAGVVVSVGAWTLFNRSGSVAPQPVALEGRVANAGLLVEPIQDLLDLDLSRVEQAVVARADPLRSEAENLWSDASRAAQGFVRGLPSPLREALQPR